MFDAFAITLREVAEMMLIVGSLWFYLARAERSALQASIGWGLVAGLLPAVVLAAWLIDAPLSHAVEAAMTIATALGVLIMAAGMVASAGRIRGRVQDVFEAALERKGAALFLGGFVALVVFREAAEIAVFLRSIAARDGVDVAGSGLLLGLLSGALLWPIGRWIRLRAPMLTLFRLSALLLSFLAIDLLVGGIGIGLESHLSAHPESRLAVLTSEFLDGGPHHGALLALLTAFPLLHALRSWWTGAGTR